MSKVLQVIYLLLVIGVLSLVAVWLYAKVAVLIRQLTKGKRK